LIKSKNLSKFSDLSHAFFNRKGGCSKGIFNSLNCGIGSSDKKVSVKKNIKIVCKKIGASDKALVLLNQTHSNKFHFISNRHKLKKKRFKGDALVTNAKNIALGILTADCVPILIFDKNKKIISAIHAGWKGAYKDIIKKVVKFLIKKGCRPKDLVASVGPCISKKKYEVQRDFIKKFIKKNKINKKFFVLRKNKTYFSLNNYVYYQLKEMGIRNLEIIKKDTFDTKNNFFSARKSIQNKSKDYGRNISIIMIN